MNISLACIGNVTVSDFAAKPRPVPYRSAHTDRAAVVATAITQIVATAPPFAQQAAIENYLRDEFAELANEGGHDDHW
jgi:hypothetical protein